MPMIGMSSTIQLDSIIFATDFSPASRNAGLYASAASVHFGIPLVIVHAFTLAQAALEVETEKPFSSQQRINLNHDLALTAEVLDAGRGTSETVLLEGDPSKVIPGFAQSRNPTMIVLGTHGGGSINRFILGSNAEGILRHSIGLVLTVGPNVNIFHTDSLPIRRILYATDCSAEAAHAAPVAMAFAEAFSAELDVLHVVQSRELEHSEQLRRLREYFYGAVAAVLPDNAGRICEPRTFVSVGQHPHTEILNHVKERGIDLLVLGLRRNTHLGMQNRTAGAFPIIVEASCPVITAAGSPHQP